ncbi:MAG: flagellar biosynthesis protein FlhF [Burkholderiaceae bacterium]|nr:flagellar biosynthesis protein FlhF [Burkholderiaceae bacterium]
MNVKRFTARTSRDALTLVRQAFGDDAVVLSTKPCAEGVEVLAMAPESVQQIERFSASAPNGNVSQAAAGNAPRGSLQARAAAAIADKPQQRTLRQQAGAPQQQSARPPAQRSEPVMDQGVADDVQTLAMSTLSFQDYVRERMLKRRQAELNAQPDPGPAPAPALPSTVRPLRPVSTPAVQQEHPPVRGSAPAVASAARRAPPVLRDEIRVQTRLRETPTLADMAPGSAKRDQQDMMNELRSMKGLIEERFGALAFMEKLQRQPAQARLTQRLLEGGFSPALTRKLVEGFPLDLQNSNADESVWATQVLQHNLLTDEAGPALEEQAGVFALIGSTGVGKTTTTAKIAANIATRHGAAQLGLITLDAYRVGAHEQLRAYGRILGVPVHTAHDRASLEDLLELLSAKKMILIDTAGMAQRDSRTRELLDMLAHKSIRKLLVVNASAQGETIEDVVLSWRASECQGVVLSKIDEAVKLGPALDTLIRHRLRVVGVANGQRVPEDWHRLSSHALIQRALRGGGASAWRVDASDVNLIFAGAPVSSAALAAGLHV